MHPVANFGDVKGAKYENINVGMKVTSVSQAIYNIVTKNISVHLVKLCLQQEQITDRPKEVIKCLEAKHAVESIYLYSIPQENTDSSDYNNNEKAAMFWATPFHMLRHVTLADRFDSPTNIHHSKLGDFRVRWEKVPVIEDAKLQIQ